LTRTTDWSCSAAGGPAQSDERPVEGLKEKDSWQLNVDEEHGLSSQTLSAHRSIFLPPNST
jgi:hypothetical protein